MGPHIGQRRDLVQLEQAGERIGGQRAVADRVNHRGFLSPLSLKNRGK
jgi:hypothetical protein